MTVFFAECGMCGWKSDHAPKRRRAMRAAQRHFETTSHAKLEIVEARK